MKSKLKWFILAGLIICLDQLTKYLIRSNFDLYQSRAVIGDLVRFTYVRNTGAAFSMSFGNDTINRWIFVTISFLAIGFIVYYFTKTKGILQNLIASLVLAGAVGNLIDRIFLGFVTDFIDCDFPDIIMKRFAIFNVADSAITIAITLLIIYILFFDKKEKKEEEIP
ncbi:MAG: signal peptidase II [Candidatus Cloacimonetes bacterium]|nr:signal peptidase II [Candidatus Cloacimonadota bacterium]